MWSENANLHFSKKEQEQRALMEEACRAMRELLLIEACLHADGKSLLDDAYFARCWLELKRMVDDAGNDGKRGDC